MRIRNIRDTQRNILPVAKLVRWFAFLTLLVVLASGCAEKRDDDTVSLVFWHAWGGYEGKFLVELVDEFNQTHSRIHVEPAHFLIGDKLMAAIAGGIPPDVATVWDWMLPTMGEAGCFVPLNEYLARDEITPDAYLPNIWEYGMFSDSKYGVPTALNVWMIFCNRTLLAKSGLDPDRTPQTVDELREWGRLLSSRDSSDKLQRIGYIPEIPYAYIWMWNFGGRLYDPASRRFVLHSPENIQALEWMRSFYRDYGIDQYRRFVATFGEYDSPNNPFYKERLGMREDGQWQLGFIKRHVPELDYSLLPFISAVEGQKSLSAVTGSFWVIPEGCRHPDEAWTFLSWLIAPEQSSRFAAELYNIPPLRASLETEGFQQLYNSRMRAFIELVLEGRVRPLPALPMGQFFFQEFNNTIERVSSGDVTADDGLRVLNDRLQNELDRSLRHMGIAEDS